MKRIALLIGCCLFVGCLCASPITGLLERIDPGASSRFRIELRKAEHDFFELDQQGDKVVVRGNNYVSIATGINWYLKYYAGIHLSWNNMRADLPDVLPKITRDGLARHQPAPGDGRDRCGLEECLAGFGLYRKGSRRFHCRAGFSGMVADEQPGRMGRTESGKLVCPSGKASETYPEADARVRHPSRIAGLLGHGTAQREGETGAGCGRPGHLVRL